MNIITLDVAPATQSFDYSNLILFAFFIVVFYFFVMRPQKKKQEQQKNFLENLKKGDAVVTIGGLCGKVYSVEEDKVVIEVDDHGRRLTFFRNAIASEIVDKQSEKK